MSKKSSPELEEIQTPRVRRSAGRCLALSKFVLLLAVAAQLCACRESGTNQAGVNLQSISADADQQILEAQKRHLIKNEVTGRVLVKKLLPDDLDGLKHEKFLLELSNGTTVLVAHDISYAPRVPINEGDYIGIHGEYIWNAEGGLIHWTHHSNSPRHEGGWIDFNGQRYQ